MYHWTKENSPHKVGVLTVIRKSDYVLVKTECPREEVVVVVMTLVFFYIQIALRKIRAEA